MIFPHTDGININGDFRLLGAVFVFFMSISYAIENAHL